MLNIDRNQPLVRKYKPKEILTDNNPFKDEWDKLCKEMSVKPIHAHPYYPQDKGKVGERNKKHCRSSLKKLKSLFLIHAFRQCNKNMGVIKHN